MFSMVMAGWGKRAAVMEPASDGVGIGLMVAVGNGGEIQDVTRVTAVNSTRYLLSIQQLYPCTAK